jgi:hypothetical protein
MGVLLCAAIVEAGGDALVRLGLRSPTHARAALFFVLGVVALTSYGYLVNARLGTSDGSSVSMGHFSSPWHN